MKLMPRNDKIVIQRLDGPKMTKGGLHLPDNAKDDQRAMTGKVVAVGPGKTAKSEDIDQMLTIAVGDVVVFGKYAGWDTEVDGEKYLVLKEEDVLAVVKQN
jgi:chaperonin GroES